ncbi:transposase family protein [Streptomyces sp. NPDC102409]|uniref:transposase family protein n=1 Tax=Streptomyces sp. NPDC102409 TaxID=3366172 RepID=UPI0037F9592E
MPRRPGRRAFVPGEREKNAIKTTTINDGQGRTLWSGAVRPGRMHDQTCVRTEGSAEQSLMHPGVTAEVDDGYRGLANECQVSAPPRKPKNLDADTTTDRDVRLARAQAPPVLLPDLHGACPRGGPAVTSAPAAHRAT